MRVLALDARLDVEVDQFTFKGAVSVYDYDVVIWSPAASLTTYSTRYAGTYQGRTSLGESESAALRRDIARRRSEFLSFLEAGRTIVVLMPHESVVFADTGERKYSGTGRNQQTTRIVGEVDILSALPMRLSRALGSGIEMSPANEIIAPLYRSIKDSLAYHSIIESSEPQLRPLLHVKGTSKLVSGMVRVNGGGLLVLLPHIYFDVEEDDDDAAEDEPVPNDVQSVKEGPEEDQGDEGEETGAVLLDWIRGLTSSSEEEPPAWVDRHVFATEAERAAELAVHEVRLAEIAKAADEVRRELAKEAQWKRLLYASGDVLERQVAAAFELFGFETQDVEPGRTDLRATRDGRNAVVEVKGLGKSAAERHAAQLEKWVAEEAAAGHDLPKGILVVAAWRNTPPGDRTEPAFPNQMIAYSQQRGHCLVSGLQLLAMVRACLEDPSRADEVAEILLTTVGTVDGWDDAAQIFVSAESTVVTEEGRPDVAPPPEEIARESDQGDAGAPRQAATCADAET